MRPWTAGKGPRRPHTRLKLQWGHGLAAVDGRSLGWIEMMAEEASMGPRPCGRGRVLSHAFFTDS